MSNLHNEQSPLDPELQNWIGEVVDAVDAGERVSIVIEVAVASEGLQSAINRLRELGVDVVLASFDD